jgi:O-antigen/teichoic acid export membrane protein
VFYATYTRLQDDRLRLSKAYYRASSLVVRTGFLFSVVFILVATEFVTILLGEKWLTMVTTFQLMVIYCLLDPLIVTSARLATAAGHPEVLTKTKAVQIVIFTPLVIAGAHFYGIEGVALAADVMVSVGFVLIIGQIRRFVDFSITRMFAVPVLAMVLAAIGSVSATYLLRPQSTWLAFLTKGIVATTIYLLTLFLLERTEYRRMLALVYQNVIRAGFLHKGDT